MSLRKCTVKNCDNKQRAKGYCTKHLYQLKKYGRILKRTKNDKNEIIKHKDYAEVVLYKGRSAEQRRMGKVKIDLDDIKKVSKYKWVSDGLGYAKTDTTENGKRKLLKMHILILGKKKDRITDHINNDGLDNRKQNLRHATYSQNCMNKNSKGYSWNKLMDMYEVYINNNKKRIHLGFYKTEKEAKKIRLKAEKKYFKEYSFNWNPPQTFNQDKELETLTQSPLI